jgi:hypothetical protein
MRSWMSPVRENAGRRTFRLKTELLEDRTQPGSVLPFSEFSMMGYELFGRDPLTGRPAEQLSEQSLVSDSGVESASGEFSAGNPERIQIVQSSQLQMVSAAPAQTESRLLQQAVGATASGTATLDLSSQVATPVQYVQPAQVQIAEQGLAFQPVALEQTINTTEEGPTTDEGIAIYTGFNGAVGADWGNAVAIDDELNGYYAGYTERNGNRDMMVWKVGLDGTTRAWEAVIGSEGGGADEARGIAITGSGDTATLWVTGYIAGTGGSDLSILRLNPTTGEILQSVALPGPGNDVGNDVDL